MKSALNLDLDIYSSYFGKLIWNVAVFQYSYASKTKPSGSEDSETPILLDNRCMEVKNDNDL